jgi:hypothetical protein
VTGGVDYDLSAHPYVEMIEAGDPTDLGATRYDFVPGGGPRAERAKVAKNSATNGA